MTFQPRGHLTISGDNIIVTTGGEVAPGMWRPGMLLNMLAHPKQPFVTKKYPSPVVDSAETGIVEELLGLGNMKTVFCQSAYWQL